MAIQGLGTPAMAELEPDSHSRPDKKRIQGRENAFKPGAFARFRPSEMRMQRFCRIAAGSGLAGTGA
jgi:hypothetical protein